VFVSLFGLYVGFVSCALAQVCSTDCSGHGVCKEIGVCSCDSGFGGEDCSKRICEEGTELCSDGATCAKNKLDCPVLCPEGTALCNDRITCVKDKTECPQGCPQEKPVSCSGGTCAVVESECPVNKCPEKEKPVLCSDGSCVEDKLECPCLEGLVKCSDGTCVKVETACLSSLCPLRFSQCPDGSCVENEFQCKGICPEGAVQCPDGICVKDLSECPKIISCTEKQPVLCPDGSCVAQKEECIHKVDVKCPFEKAIFCPDGSCVTDPSWCLKEEVTKGDEVTLKDLVRFSLRELNAARRHLSRSSKVARPISRKVLKLMREIKVILARGGEECEDNVNDVLDDLLELVEEVDELACFDEDDDFDFRLGKDSHEDEEEFEEDCIPTGAVDEFIVIVEDATNIIFSAFDFDEDDDFVPDLCQ
jgi:hypothetical protein